MDLIITLLYILFILSAVVLVVVVLLQEGRGGGLTDALGTAGQQTFGVAASGIHKFTGWTGAVFVASALLIHVLNRQAAESSVVGDFGQPAIVAPPGDQPAAPPNAPPNTPPATPPGDTPPGGG
jgi:preprotein translocase subunit SecG